MTEPQDGHWPQYAPPAPVTPVSAPPLPPPVPAQPAPVSPSFPPASFPPASYAPAFPQPSVAQPSYPPQQSSFAPPPPPTQQQPWVAPPQLEYGGAVQHGQVPEYGAPLPARPARQRNVLGWVAMALGLVLLAVAVVQTVFLVKLSDRADRQAAELRETNTTLAEARSELDAATKQLAGVDERTKGSLDSATVAKKVLPSVFRVRAGNATGTAFAFGTSGSATLLVTNFHVVEGVVRSGSRSATLERGKERHPVQIVKMDERRDLAVLQSPKSFPRLKPAEAAVQPGQPVVVVGAPLGLADTVTTGVVSAVRADVPGLDSRVIQFDAAISPGNSGGPVSNAQGQVVGVAQAKIVRDDADGLALAIPISEVCDGLVDC